MAEETDPDMTPRGLSGSPTLEQEHHHLITSCCQEGGLWK